MMVGSRPPLAGVRVLDLGAYLAGPLAAMLLTDQGADTIKVEPPCGPPLRHPVNAALDRGKTVIRTDLKSEVGRERIATLARDADVLIENFGAGVMDRLGLSVASLRAANPALVVLSLPGFAPGDPLDQGAKAYEGVIAAATGQYTDVHPMRRLLGLDPVYTALPLASVYAGVHAATAAVLALARRKTGVGGVHVVTPLAAAAVSAMTNMYMGVEGQPDRYAAPRLPRAVQRYVLPAVRAFARRWPFMQPRLLGIAREAYPALMSSYAAIDGALVYLFALDNHKVADAAVRTLGLEEATAELKLARADPYVSGDRPDNLWEGSNLSRALQAALKERIAARIATDTAEAWEERLNAAGVPAARQRTLAEWLRLGPVRRAGLVVEVEDPDLGPTIQPGPQVWLDDVSLPIAPRRLADADAIAWPAREKRRTERAGATLPTAPPSAWLEGLTVLDMTSMVAGPVAGRTLAEYGAHVVKLDAPRPNHGPRMTCWYGLDVNQGKQSLLVDAKTDEGRRLVLGLIAKSDVLLTNHLNEALERLGLGEDEVRRVRPEIVTASISAYGGPAGGPWAGRHGYDPVLQAATGIMVRYGDPGHPEIHAIASCVDALTGYSAAFGIALALLRRDDTSLGGVVRTSLAAAATLVQLPYAVADGATRRGEAGGQGARGEGPLYRLYRARDGWLFAASPHLDPQRAAGRLGLPADDTADLASILEERIGRMRLVEAAEWLRGAGISSTKVRSIPELREELTAHPDGPGLRLVSRDVPGLGPVVQAPPLQIVADGLSLKAIGPAPKPGADLDRVAAELGVDAGRLVQEGVAARELNRDYLPH